MTSVEGITEYRLANGLRVLLFPDPSKQTVTVNITYLVGSRYEGNGETGMAHLLEHMLFKGSTRHRNIPQELSEHGARPNGSTSYDRTNYHEIFSASPANLEWALDLEADRMVNSFVARKDLDSEMTVVRNEYEAGENNPLRVLIQRTDAAAYLWHSYGKATIGARSDIEKVPIERLQRFYHTYYQPDNAVLLVAGKLDAGEPRFDAKRQRRGPDPGATLALIQKKFGVIPRPARPLPVTYTDEPTQDGERQVTVRRVGDVQAVCADYHVPAGSHPDFAVIDLLTVILGDEPSGRLHKALIESKKAARVFAFGRQLREPGTVTFAAELRREMSLDDARDTLLKTVESLATTPPTKEEVERARAQLLKEIDLELSSSERIGLALSEWVAMGDWRLYFLHRDRIRKVTPEDVQRVAAAYLKPANRTVGLFIPTPSPDRAPIPPTPDIAAMLRDYHGDVVASAGEAFDPSPANIDRRTRLATAGGLKLALLPKKTRGQVVHAVLALHFGDQQSLMNQAVVGRLTAAMLMRGTAHHTRQQLQDELDRLKAHLDVGGDATGVHVSIETTRENLPAVLKLAAEILREPSFPAEEFATLQQERLSAVEQSKSQPNVVASIAFRRHLYPYPKGDVRYVLTPDEQAAEIKATELSALKQFHEAFYGASRGELAVVGDVDDPAIEKLAGELFGGWKNQHPYTRIASRYQKIPALQQRTEMPDKPNAIFLAGLLLEVQEDDPDYPALVLGNYILGGGFINSRLGTRIRQKEGLSYGVGTQLQVDSIDRLGTLMAYAIYAPENRTRLETAFQEEIARALREGFTAQEVATAKSGELQERQVSRAQDSELADKLADYRFLNRTLAWDADLEKRLQALTLEQTAAALRKYLDPARLTIVEVGDFAKTAQRPEASGSGR